MKILLSADTSPEIGLGHAMRMLAVAEALEGRAMVFWATNTPEAVRRLNPPCPVHDRNGGGLKPLIDSAHRVLLDGVSYPDNDTRVWHMVDYGTGVHGTNRICPHFGAEDRDWGPGWVCTGPRWMPLRKDTVRRYSPAKFPGYDSEGPVLRYKSGDISLGKWWEKKWQIALVPPSTIAYECMALGIPVVLQRPPNDQPTEIAEAMVEDGVAWNAEVNLETRFGPQITKASDMVDGMGAERISKLLLSQ